MASALGYDSQSRHLNQLPLYHDMGLIGGLLLPLFSGCEGTFMDPAQVLLRPQSWLEAIQRYGITHSGGPNFIYDLMLDIGDAELASLDLSLWRVAFCGAEPIRPTTVERFCQRFASCGFKRSAFHPCYGLAEATLLVTIHPLPEEEIETSQGAPLSSGTAALNVEVAIVNPDSFDRCREGSKGEIWVKGPSVAAGYWRRPTLSREMFGAFMRNTNEGPYLRTGDLGFLKNGHLHVIGRIKDMIIVHGRKHAPQDLEHEVERSDPAMRYCAAFSYDDAGNAESVALVVEVRRRELRDHARLSALRHLIMQAIFSAFQLRVDAIEFVAPYAVPRTSSGKIRRAQARADFLSGKLRTPEFGPAVAA
jgi:acyl-CoA synthetase (AMP-forming)/AMP-acid ligase II